MALEGLALRKVSDGGEVTNGGGELVRSE